MVVVELAHPQQLLEGGDHPLAAAHHVRHVVTGVVPQTNLQSINFTHIQISITFHLCFLLLAVIPAVLVLLYLLAGEEELQQLLYLGWGQQATQDHKPVYVESRNP